MLSMTQHPLFMIAVYCMSSYKSSSSNGGAASRSRWWRPGDGGNPRTPRRTEPRRAEQFAVALPPALLSRILFLATPVPLLTDLIISPLLLLEGISVSISTTRCCNSPAADRVREQCAMPRRRRRHGVVGAAQIALRTTLTRVKFLSMIHGEKCWKCIDTAAVRASKQTLHYSKMGNP